MTSSTLPNISTLRIDRRHFLRTATVAGGAAAILAGSGFAARGSASSVLGSLTTSTPAASPGASPAASPVASPAASGVEIGMIDIAYEVKEFSIPANTDSVVTLVNNGFLQHNFVIDELGLESPMYNGGDSGTVTINAPAGTYEYYCSVPGHREAGMVGSLTVS